MAPSEAPLSLSQAQALVIEAARSTAHRSRDGQSWRLQECLRHQRYAVEQLELAELRCPEHVLAGLKLKEAR